MRWQRAAFTREISVQGNRLAAGEAATRPPLFICVQLRSPPRRGLRALTASLNSQQPSVRLRNILFDSRMACSGSSRSTRPGQHRFLPAKSGQSALRPFLIYDSIVVLMNDGTRTRRYGKCAAPNPNRSWRIFTVEGTPSAHDDHRIPEQGVMLPMGCRSTTSSEC